MPWSAATRTRSTAGFDVHQLLDNVLVLKVPGYQRWDRSERRSRHVAGNYEVWNLVAVKTNPSAATTLVTVGDLIVRFPIDKPGPFQPPAPEDDAEFERRVRGGG
jgi:hypothetical protein